MSDGERLDAKEREDRKLRRLQWLVQLTTNILTRGDLSVEEAVRYVEGLRNYALKLFPGKEKAWEMIYQPRFSRILKERWGYVINTDTDLTEAG